MKRGDICSTLQSHDYRYSKGLTFGDVPSVFYSPWPACWRTTSAQGSDPQPTLPRERPANQQEQPFASMSASAGAQEQGAPAAGARAPATADFLRMPGNDTCFDCDVSCAQGPEP